MYDGGLCGNSLPSLCYGCWWVCVPLCRTPDARNSCWIWSWIAPPLQLSTTLSWFLSLLSCSHVKLGTLEIHPYVAVVPAVTRMCLLLSPCSCSASPSVSWECLGWSQERQNGRHLLQGDRPCCSDYAVLARIWLSPGVGRVWNQAGVSHSFPNILCNSPWVRSPLL